MKFIALSFLLLVSANSFAQLSDSSQLSIVEGIAKNDRRDMWRMGMTDVSSSVLKPTKSQIDEIMKRNNEIANPLNRDEVSSVYKCYHSPARCVVYIIDLYGEMYGGSGSSRRWVLLNPHTGKYSSLLHEVYAE